MIVKRTPGRQRCLVQGLRAGPIACHRHIGGYAAIILDGGYVERGEGGIRTGAVGEVVIHLPFEAHANHVAAAGANVFNVPLSLAAALALRSGRLADPAAAVAAIGRGADPVEVLAIAHPTPSCPPGEEADALALQLEAGSVRSLDVIARDLGLAPRTLRRQFGQLYGMSAASFRLRTRARRAWRAIVTTDHPLAAIASDCGFADQAHMTRAVIRLTGATPTTLRAGRFVQDDRAAIGHPARDDDPVPRPVTCRHDPGGLRSLA